LTEYRIGTPAFEYDQGDTQMASFTMVRKDYPEAKAATVWQKYAAFRTLFVDGRHDKAANSVDVIIRGEWPSAYNGDGLFLRYNGGANVTAFGFDEVEITWKDSTTGKTEVIKLPLCPTEDTGWDEITFITTFKRD
jgi:hypothetical protein